MEAIISYLCEIATLQNGSDVQWMVHPNQHVAAAFHLVVSMNVWLLYELNGVKPKQLLLF